MFTNLLLPLDGSRMAEAALPLATALADNLNAKVTLLHVIEKHAPPTIHGDHHISAADEGQVYLENVQKRLQALGLKVEMHVHETAQGDVAVSICRHAEELENDCIVLATHGKGSGMRAFFAGSIAQQVLGGGTRPVLVVRPENEVIPYICRRIIVPLDTKARHEAALPVAQKLASVLSATVDLVTVVPRRSDLEGAQAQAARLHPLSSAVQLALGEQAAEDYLKTLAARLSQPVAQNLSTTEESTAPAVGYHILRGDPVSALVDYFTEAKPDLVVMASHALRGWQAFWEGSVTPKVLMQWSGPVLLWKTT